MYQETVKDIIATASILIKMDREDILEDQDLFVEFLNELGFKSPSGEYFTKAGFRQMMKRIPENQKAELVEMFNLGHRATEQQMMMYTTH
ncbi:10 kDa anti-sigma factor [Aeromonas phage AhFM11]|nr:10 kDa anti-sigma factor [Aeromonas phage AhFM11]